MLNERLPLFKKSICISLCLIGLTFNVNADISVQEPVLKSYIGQSLSISIPVTADTTDWDTLWGTVETSTGETLETSWRRPYSPGTIGYIDVKTTNIINTPVVDLVVRVESIKNKIITNYPILLDTHTIAMTTQVKTTNYRDQTELPVVPSVLSVSSQSIEIAKIDKIDSLLQTKQSESVISDINKKTNVVNSYVITVKAGDNLYAIAKKYKNLNQSTWQMMQSIYKNSNNKKAFGKTMGMLYTGVKLVIE